MTEQIIIGICGLASVWLSQSPRVRTQRWACIFGLCAQPAWFYATWQAGQWGIFILSLIYTIGWLRGVHTFWWRSYVAH
ncbi:MAG: hypothetical protein ABI624_06625 [Casimicrobiaceae bacterium]